uniref:Cadherin 17, LI cadherin (liver-intestine) n=1 Tax=Sparus aurata TaxID=8175 RepID=A0A671UKS6_SPAAU
NTRLLHIHYKLMWTCHAYSIMLSPKQLQIISYCFHFALFIPISNPQFQVTSAGVNNFRLSGEGKEDISISNDGWLYLQRPLDWWSSLLLLTHKKLYVYTALVREHNPAGVPFTRVFALDKDDPETPNAQLSYSLVSQIPNRLHTPLFQINPETGEISTTEDGSQMLKAREGILYSKGADRSIEALKSKFDDYCPQPKLPYEQNPFFTCVQRAEMRRSNVDPLVDPDFTLIVRVQDLGGASETALSGNTEVHIVVQQNLWVNPGPIPVEEHLRETYPLTISNEPNAVYALVQKERELKFPFQITEDGDIHLTEELDREDKDMYILVVRATDNSGNEVDPPMEIHVIVDDINDNAPECENEESVFELQEGEPVGNEVGELKAHDADKEGTLNSLLSYTIENPDGSPFSIDAASGRIQALRSLQRRDQQVYNLTIKVKDPVFSTNCKVVIKVIDVNNELPLFEKNDYGSQTLAEDTPVEHTVLTIRATDADDPDSGSSRIEFHISAGDDDGVFAVQTDGNGVGHLVIAKPLDFETASTYDLKIDARNPEPLMTGLVYGSESTAVFSISVTDIDEVPEFSSDILEVTVPENTTKGSVLLTVEAKDPEGKDINFKLDGDTYGWLEIDKVSGVIKTKGKLDRETLETLTVTVTAFETANREMHSELDLTVRLLDVNDNAPEMINNQAFICMMKPEPVIIKAKDGDSAPFSQPFTFVLGSGKSQNWGLVRIDDTTAKLTLRKKPTEDKTYHLPITIKDNAGMGVARLFEVRVCNCTELGYCYMPPGRHGHIYGTGATVGILVGTLAFCGKPEKNSSLLTRNSHMRQYPLYSAV